MAPIRDASPALEGEATSEPADVSAPDVRLESFTCTRSGMIGNLDIKRVWRKKERQLNYSPAIYHCFRCQGSQVFGVYLAWDSNLWSTNWHRGWTIHWATATHSEKQMVLIAWISRRRDGWRPYIGSRMGNSRPSRAAFPQGFQQIPLWYALIVWTLLKLVMSHDQSWVGLRYLEIMQIYRPSRQGVANSWSFECATATTKNSNSATKQETT